jgi:CelD/BcsL family acetyltransferase involved in cellulose biosynthesis
MTNVEAPVKPAGPGPTSVRAPAPQHAGRRHRKRDHSSLSVEPIGTLKAAEEIHTAWRELYDRSGSCNPYASPDWLIPWARHFVRERELAILAVFRNGTLIGVAPWYVDRTGPLLARVHLLGSGPRDILTELPQVLTAPDEVRSVLRAVLGHWSQIAGMWDWLELPMLEEQGWFEPEWLTGAVGDLGFVQQKLTRPSVVLSLPSDVSALHEGMKRNLRESTHRARNRLDRTGRPWAVTTHAGADDIRNPLGVLAQLHAARADLVGRRHHGDQLARPEQREFLADALGAMADRDRAEILTLDVEGIPVAAQLVLRAPDATYLGPSGVDPAWWEVSPVTLLQLRAAESAVERGHREFNLSTGPGAAKFRWSERVVQNPEFIVCGPRRRSRAAFTAYRALSAIVGVRHDATVHRTKTTARTTGMINRRRQAAAPESPIVRRTSTNTHET